MSTRFKNDVQLILFKADRAFSHVFISSVYFVHDHFDIYYAFCSQFFYIFGFLFKHLISCIFIFKVSSSSHYRGFTLRWLSIRNLKLVPLIIICIIISWFRLLYRYAFILKLSILNRFIFIKIVCIIFLAAPSTFVSEHN